MQKIHDFTESLEKSKEDSKKPIWKELFQHFWPGCTIESYDEAKGVQLSGADVILLCRYKPVFVDCKYRPPRKRAFNDILLETWSNAEREVLGWAVDGTKKTDYYLYLNHTNDTCQKIPAVPVRRALNKYREKWESIYKVAKAPNRTYTTISVCVPVDVVNEACQEFGEGVESIKLEDLKKKPRKVNREIDF